MKDSPFGTIEEVIELIFRVLCDDLPRAKIRALYLLLGLTRPTFCFGVDFFPFSSYIIEYMAGLIKRNETCRGCKGKKLTKVFSFGPTPLANGFLKPERIYQPEYLFPLDVHFCRDCTMLQLRDVVSPKHMFKDYVYVSSTSPVFIKHFENLAADVHQRFGLSKKALVIDIGSNDGILLKPFKKLGARVLCIEPAVTVAKIARRNGIATLTNFFNRQVAETALKKCGPAAVVTGTNVFAHIDDLDELISGVKRMTKPEGVFIIEVPYLVDFIEKNLFDTVYHEHLSYFAIRPMRGLFDRLGMEIFDVIKVPTHGGSIRVFAQKKGMRHSVTPAVEKFLDLETKTKLHDIATYQNYAARVQANKGKLISMLTKLKAQGKRIAGYGAPGKGNTLLNFFSIGTETLDFIADDSPQKQGLFTPGKHIPVVHPQEIYKQKPDYLFIIAWNFAEPIMKNHARFREQGGKFIVPVPKPKIV